MIPFPQPMRKGRLIRRYKRFLADIVLDDGQEITAHCANTGSMKGLTVPESAVLVWDSQNPKRKLPWSWKAVQIPGGAWVGIDTGLPNALVAEALRRGVIPGLVGATEVKREQKMGDRSRVDAVALGPWGRAWVEVKNVTLVDAETGVARFPDAVTSRGLKHLRELSERVREGDRAAMVYVVQRADARSFAPADDIDPAYGDGLRAALDAGVEVVVLGCEVTSEGVSVTGTLPWVRALV